MNTIFNLKKNSHLMTNKESTLINTILQDYCVENLINNSGEYLKNLPEIDMYWCYNFTNDNGIFGAWNQLYKNSIFIKPSFYNEQYREYYINNDLKNNETSFALYKVYKKQYQDEYIQVTNNTIKYLATPIVNKMWITDFDFYYTIQYILSSENLLLISSICHELYHRKQFIDKPIKYCLLSAIGLFIPYETQCNLSWTIEGDVRIKVDNEANQSLQKNFDNVFRYIEQAGLLFKNKKILSNEEYSKYLTEQNKNTIKDQEDYLKHKSDIKNTIEYQFLLKILSPIFESKFLAFIENFS